MEGGNIFEPVVAELTAHPYRFSAFQAVYLIQRMLSDCDRVGTFGRPEREALRLTNVDSLSFPGSQIQSVTAIEDGGRRYFRTAITSMGLYGVFSPLPLSYTACLISPHEEGSEQRQRLRDFLDIFNHRILSLACRVDEYRHLHRSYSPDDADSFAAAALAFSGLTLEQIRADFAPWMISSLTMTRLLSSHTRSAAGMESWLTAHFRGTGVAVEEFSPQWVRIPEEELSSLGRRNCSLGGHDDGTVYDGNVGTTIGEWILDCETKFRVIVGPLDWAQFVYFLPSGEGFGKLVALVKFYVPDWLQFDFAVKLTGYECRHLKVCLDGRTSWLGFTTGLFPDEGSREELQLILQPAWVGEN